mmetsp:Transcript_62115/g.114420  ORF Transcript_62115/g.114420 Transcript_62115/m.114420 type:complete len:255 (-) Transcript_62115:35-799(-)
MGEPMPRQNEAPVEKSPSSGLASSAHLHAPPCSMLRHCQTATGYRSHPCPQLDLHAHARRSHLPHPPHLRHLRHPRPPHPHPHPRPRRDHLLHSRPLHPLPPHARPPHAHHLHAGSLHARAPPIQSMKQDGRHLPLQVKQDGHRLPPLRALPPHGHPLHAHHRCAHPAHDRLLHARPLHARHLCLHHLQAREAHVPLQAKPNGHRHLSPRCLALQVKARHPQEAHGYERPLQAPLHCLDSPEHRPSSPRHRCPP